MSPVEFEPTISAGERPQTYALDRARGHWVRRSVLSSDLKILVQVMGQDWKCLRCHARPSFLLLMAVLPYRTNVLVAVAGCIWTLPSNSEGSKSAHTTCDLE